VATSARAITPVSVFILSNFLSENIFISIKEILRKLYHYNHRTENWDLNKPNPKAVPSHPSDAPSESQPKNLGNPTTSLSCDNTQSESSIHIWGGPLIRRVLQAIYTIAFICLLRSDEVLKIRRDHIEFVKEDDEIQYMVLTLPFRKTHQDGRKFSRFY